MAGGPTNYNHDKLTKVITDQKLGSAYWINILEHDMVLSESRMQHIKKKCSAGCEICILRITITPVVQFRAEPEYKRFSQRNAENKNPNFGKWKVYHNPPYTIIRQDVLANPAYSPDLVYISGAGGCASMMKYAGQWWFVYGTPNVKMPKKDPTPVIITANGLGSSYWEERGERERLLVLHNVLKKDWDTTYAEGIVTGVQDAFARFVNGEQEESKD